MSIVVDERDAASIVDRWRRSAQAEEHAGAILDWMRDDGLVRRQGLVVLPVRTLKGHLRRHRAKLSPDDVSTLHSRLVAAIAV